MDVGIIGGVSLCKLVLQSFKFIHYHIYISNKLQGRDGIHVVPVHMSVCNKFISFIRKQI